MRGRARRRATGTFAGALTATVLVALASVPAGATSAAGTTVPPAAPPTLRGTIVPGTVIIRATTTPAPAAPTSPRTNPPATAGATAAPRPATTAAPARTTVPPTTAAPTTVATTLPPTTEAAPSTTTEEVAEVTTVTTTAAAVGDSAASSRNSRIAWALALMGVLVGALTAWFWYATRPVPVGMAGLAEMGTPRWWRADARKREQILARSRKGTTALDDDALVVPLAAVAAADATVPEDLPAWARDPDAAGPAAPAPVALPWVDAAGDATPPGGIPLPSVEVVPPAEVVPSADVVAVAEVAAVEVVPVAEVVAAEVVPSVEAPAVLVSAADPPARTPASSPWAPPRTGEEAATAGDHG